MRVFMRENMSSSRRGEPWAQFYPHNISGGGAPATMLSDHGVSSSDATVVVTMTTRSSTTVTSSSSTTPSPHGRTRGPAAAVVIDDDPQLNPSELGGREGVSRVPIRRKRRSRASRRTPTTLLNTDTTNFRVMVQHFTGGPSSSAAAAAAALPFASGRSQYPNPHPLGAALNFNFGGLGLGMTRQQTVNPNTVVMVPSGAYHHLQFQQQQQQQQHQRPYTFPLTTSRSTSTTQLGGHGEAFLQRLIGNSRPPHGMEMNVPAPPRFPMEAISSHVPPAPPQPPSTSENKNVNSTNFMF